jgi:hypothetical protein
LAAFGVILRGDIPMSSLQASESSA